MPIGPKTNVCAILGHPVGHSLSPAMHNAAFESLGLDFVYVAHDVPPDGLAGAFAGVRAMGYRGLSITIPHKLAALRLVDEVDRVAAGIGCINTVINDHGHLKGYNSDGLGALGALRRADADPENRCVLVLGSGGAARAISMTMALEAPPKCLKILGILPKELEQLAHDIRSRTTVDVVTGPLDREHLAEFLRSADLLLQTTPIGMAPESDASPVPAELLKSDLVVFDAIYNPRRTKLLSDAVAAGARIVEGLEMFLGQALTQFELFTGNSPPEGVMRQVLESRLGR